MSKKKKGQTLESMNKGFSVPDTYIIIFFVVCLAALLTYLIPQGLYETEDITYMIDGAEKTRTVIKDGSFQYVLDEAGNPVKQGIGLFAAGGQFTITAAYTYAPAREISIYDYSQIVFATLLGLILFGEMPDLLSFAGYGCIILGSLMMFLYNRNH